MIDGIARDVITIDHMQCMKDRARRCSEIALGGQDSVVGQLLGSAPIELQSVALVAELSDPVCDTLPRGVGSAPSPPMLVPSSLSDLGGRWRIMWQD
jgi:hypothetical protein